MRDLKDFLYGAYLVLKYGGLTATIVGLFFGPALLADAVSMWFLLIYAPMIIFVLWGVGTDNREKNEGYKL